jgi:hypothetical protein
MKRWPDNQMKSLPAVFIMEQLFVFTGYQVGAEGNFHHLAETKLPDHTNKNLVLHILKFSRKTWRNHGDDPGIFFKKFCYALAVNPENLGILAANFHAIAAKDAAFVHYLSLAIVDLDGLGRAFPHAGVTHPASLPDGIYYFIVLSQ